MSFTFCIFFRTSGSGFPTYTTDDHQNPAQSDLNETLTKVVLLNNVDESKVEKEDIFHVREPEDSLGTDNWFKEYQLLVDESKLDVLNTVQSKNEEMKENAEIQTPTSSEQKQLKNEETKEDAEIKTPTSSEQRQLKVSVKGSPDVNIETSKGVETKADSENLDFATASLEQTNKTLPTKETSLTTKETIPTSVNKETYQYSPTQGSGIFSLSQTSNPKFILLFKYPTIQTLVEDNTPYPVYKAPRYSYGPSYRSSPFYSALPFPRRQYPSFYRSNPWLSQSLRHVYRPRNYYSGLLLYTKKNFS